MNKVKKILWEILEYLKIQTSIAFYHHIGKYQDVIIEKIYDFYYYVDDGYKYNENRFISHVDKVLLQYNLPVKSKFFYELEDYKNIFKQILHNKPKELFLYIMKKRKGEKISANQIIEDLYENNVVHSTDIKIKCIEKARRYALTPSKKTMAKLIGCMLYTTDYLIPPEENDEAKIKHFSEEIDVRLNPSGHISDFTFFKGNRNIQGNDSVLKNLKELKRFFTSIGFEEAKEILKEEIEELEKERIVYNT